LKFIYYDINYGGTSDVIGGSDISLVFSIGYVIASVEGLGFNWWNNELEHRMMLAQFNF
jgi:hypothetical protein